MTASVADRIDPKSPHYDAAFAALRAKAFGAAADHKRDMATKPAYRAEIKRRFGKDAK